MSLQNPTVILCTHCSKIMRDERSTPNALYAMRYDECATCRAKMRTHIDEIRTGVEFTPLVKTDRQPSLPTSSPQAAASPVPDLRDGIHFADDDGDSLTFDVRLVMTAKTAVEDGARYWSGATRIVCGGSKTCASLDYRGNLHDYGLGKQLVDAIEAEIAARQPKRGDE